MITDQSETLTFTLDNLDDLSLLFGIHDKNIKFLEEQTQVTINNRGQLVQLIGKKEEMLLIKDILESLQQLIHHGIHIHLSDVVSALKLARKNQLDVFLMMFEDEILKDYHGKPIRVKNLGQKKYVDQIDRHDIVFGIGPAGTGKTFLAVTMAVAALKKGNVQKIILTRPAVDAGESLGFLPGDLKEKVDPYLRPIYDSLYQTLGMEYTERLIERKVIEIAPLAYMRGRTLNDAFVILDEAQNTTIAQMKMFLTRLGFNSKMVVNGDTSQVDLPKNVTSGLMHAKKTLQTIKQVRFVNFKTEDVVRHPVVAEIIDAYENGQ
ncbi:PhoH-like protein PhoH [Melissococcus plutonius]|uniref:PhoH-like protein n=1 Tax=Melissococcus plutonius (strain ATCC 35311 / DSM 29964 / CIP 104052 / LMG 20360 / NCIMB 702443) TaxID=940190 RepID=F3YB05_MELPT|nr:PhoH-like protein PhoH [Melissococcus plutonius S1]KMT25361.1 PhoH-like protein PhoH [Melissococcus plutonius]BAK21683.1 phosphate starvation-inducible protein PhoH, predicted ATPase [Melissococcus plutonius ATCC 35311]KMT25630.1 PhoH-like protein PhoH [Melissococcus plutonius]KMT26265.1 PhoH-like protein PhoH [Melissococcus plutonius]